MTDRQDDFQPTAAVRESMDGFDPYSQGVTDGAEAERARIAADMREAAYHWTPQPNEAGEMRTALLLLSSKFREFADRYERGDHA